MNPYDLIDKEVIYKGKVYEVRKYSEKYKFFELGSWTVDYNQLAVPEEVVMGLEIWEGVDLGKYKDDNPFERLRQEIGVESLFGRTLVDLYREGK